MGRHGFQHVHSHRIPDYPVDASAGCLNLAFTKSPTADTAVKTRAVEVFATQHTSFLLDLFLDKSCRGLDAAALVANKVVPELSAK